MVEVHSRNGKRVETLEVNTEPHERYNTYDPQSEGSVMPGVPIPHSGPRGQVLRKKIKYKIFVCEECEAAGRYEEGVPVCPECGVVFLSDGAGEQMLRDAKAAGRV